MRNAFASANERQRSIRKRGRVQQGEKCARALRALPNTEKRRAAACRKQGDTRARGAGRSAAALSSASAGPPSGGTESKEPSTEHETARAVRSRRVSGRRARGKVRSRPAGAPQRGCGWRRRAAVRTLAEGASRFAAPLPARGSFDSAALRAAPLRMTGAGGPALRMTKIGNPPLRVAGPATPAATLSESAVRRDRAFDRGAAGTPGGRDTAALSS